MRRVSLSILAVMFCLVVSDVIAQQSNTNTLRIMSYNVRNCKGMDDVRDYDRTASVIKDFSPDVVALQELDSVTNRSKGEDVLIELASRLDMDYIYGTAIDYDGGRYGIGMLCKEKPKSLKKVALPGREERRALLIVEFDKYVLCATHLSITEQDRELSVPIIISECRGYNKPLFLAGDLNAKPESNVISALEEYFTMINDKSVMTSPADIPDSTIDYIAIRNEDRESVKIISSTVVEAVVESDHRPVTAVVTISNN